MAEREHEPAEARAFVVELAEALHRAGTPAHRLERALRGVCARLGEPAQVFTTPTQLEIAFGPVTDQRVVLLRVEPGEVDLGRLAALDETADAVVTGALGLAEGRERVRRIAQEAAGPPPWLAVLAFGVSSAAAARFFGGGLAEMGLAGLLGLLAGLLALLLGRRVAGAQLFELLASLLVGAGAAAAPRLGLHASPQVTTLAGLIVLVPGFTLTVAMHELATRNLVSGTTRLTAAGISFLQIGFGATVGALLAARLGPLPAGLQPHALPPWTEPPVLLLATLSAAVLFRARPRALPLVVVAGALAFYGARLGAWLLGPELGASVGAFLVAAASNGWARLSHRPAMVPLVPGLLLLVPGSLGFRSLTSLLHDDVLAGVDTAFTMLLVAVSIVAGMLLANAAVPPRRSL